MTYEKLAIEPAYDLAFVRADSGVSPDQLKASVEKAAAAFPNAKMQSNKEFKDDVEGEVDGILICSTRCSP